MSIGRATIWDTVVYSGEALHPQLQRVVHVIGVQNRVINESNRANALIIPVPALAPLTRENLIDVPRMAFEDMAGTLRQMDPNRALTLQQGVRGATQVQPGVYGVAIANRPEDYLPALETIPEPLRPPQDRSALAAYARWYPGWPLVLCCWSGRMHAAPVCLWYEPQRQSALFLPALESPQGGVPRPLEVLPRDYTLVVGSTTQPFGVGVRSRGLPNAVRPYLPDRIWGTLVQGLQPNVDFEVSTASLHQLRNAAGKYDLHERLDPKVWKVKFEASIPSRRE